MAEAPKPKVASKTCTKCGTYLSGAAYYSTKSRFFSDGLLPICKMCLAEIVGTEDWASMDKFCQWADYPFNPDTWLKLSREIGKKALDAYVKAYTNSDNYGAISWQEVHEEWVKILKDKSYREKVPELSEATLMDLQQTWGVDYSKEDLQYMDEFYKRLCKSHNIITPIQEDNARNVCKLSVRISKKISDDKDVDKDIKSYTELMKTGGFTTENVKNMSDFESVGELIAYLERTGWRNPYYDGVAKDVVDESMANMQSFLRRIVMGEANLKETIDQRLSAMGLNKPGELDFSDAELDRYEKEGYDEVQSVTTDDDDDNTLDEESE